MRQIILSVLVFFPLTKIVQCLLRFQNSTSFPKRKDTDLTLFIYITSGPAHDRLREAARKTWLLPCRASPSCEYKFFIDSENITKSLQIELRNHSGIHEKYTTEMQIS